VTPARPRTNRGAFQSLATLRAQESTRSSSLPLPLVLSELASQAGQFLLSQRKKRTDLLVIHADRHGDGMAVGTLVPESKGDGMQRRKPGDSLPPVHDKGQ
jgi:hypothetical protein